MKSFAGKNAILTQAIVTTLTTRGDGIKTPIRVIKEVFGVTGDKIAEDDPLSYTTEEILKIIGELPCTATLEDFRGKLLCK